MKKIFSVFAVLLLVVLVTACNKKTTTTTTKATTASSTVAPTTVAPTTKAPTTVAPTTKAPTTVAPTTKAPTTVAPTTKAPTTVAPTTKAPTTVAPTTVAPTTVAPTTVAPTTTEDTTVYTEITTIGELLAMETGVNYKLMNDIDATGVEWTGSALDYSGIFNGNGYMIKGMNVSGSSTNKTGLLFRDLTNATVKNLTLKNCNIDGAQEGLGLIAGHVNGLNKTEGVVNFYNIEIISCSVATNGSNYGALLSGRDTAGTVNVDGICVKGTTTISAASYTAGLLADGRNAVGINVNNARIKMTFIGSSCGNISGAIANRVKAEATASITNSILDITSLNAGASSFSIIAGNAALTGGINYRNVVLTGVLAAARDLTADNKGSVVNAENCYYITDKSNNFTTSNFTAVTSAEVNTNWYLSTAKVGNAFEAEGTGVKLKYESANVLPAGAVLQSLKVSTILATTRYKVGETFSSDKVLVTGVYVLPDTTLFEMDLEASEYTIACPTFDNTKSGTYPVAVTSTANSSISTNYEVTVVEINDIQVFITKATNVYILDTTGATALNTSGLIVKAVMSDGKTEVLSASDYSAVCSTFDSSVVGEYEVTVTINGSEQGVPKEYSKTYKVNVVTPGSLTEVEVSVDSSATIGLVGGVPTFNTIKDGLDYIKALNLEASVAKTLYIAAGIYNEKLTINIPNLTIVGEDEATTIIAYNCAAGFPTLEQVGTYGTDKSAVVEVTSAATGVFINNITFKNLFDYYNDKSAGGDTQALAIRVDADMFTAYNCSFYGYQDTLQAKTGRQFYYECYIEGCVDFIFGTDATAFFEKCEIHCVTRDDDKNNGYICAPKTSASITYGFVFYDCDFTADASIPDGTVSLARPWGPDAQAAFVNCRLGKHISLAGYSDVAEQPNDRYEIMSGNLPQGARFYEYGNTGDGAITTAVIGCTMLDATTSVPYTSADTILGVTATFTTAWDPNLFLETEPK